VPLPVPERSVSASSMIPRFSLLDSSIAKSSGIVFDILDSAYRCQK